MTANDSGNDILAIRAENESPAGFKRDKENQSYFNPAGAGNCTGVNQFFTLIFIYFFCGLLMLLESRSLSKIIIKKNLVELKTNTTYR